MRQCSHHDNLLNAQNLNQEPSRVCYIHFHQRTPKAGSQRPSPYIIFLNECSFRLLRPIDWKWNYRMWQRSSAVTYWTAAPWVCRNCNASDSLKDSLSGYHTGFFCSLLPHCHIYKAKTLFCHSTQQKNLNNESSLDTFVLLFPLYSFWVWLIRLYLAVIMGHFSSAHVCYVIYESKCYWGRLWRVKEAGSSAGGIGGVSNSVDLQWHVWKSDPRAIVKEKRGL